MESFSLEVEQQLLLPGPIKILPESLDCVLIWTSNSVASSAIRETTLKSGHVVDSSVDVRRHGRNGAKLEYHFTKVNRANPVLVHYI